MSLIEPATLFAWDFETTGYRRPTAACRAHAARRDGSVIRWGAADMSGPPPVVSPGRPAPITIAVFPVRPGHAVTVEYRVTAARSAKRWLSPCPAPTLPTSACFGRSCRGNRAGWSISCRSFASPDSRSRLASTESTDCPRYQVGGSAAGGATASATPHAIAASSAAPGVNLAGKPRWDWNTKLLWTSSIGIRKEVIGKVPDGLRINWYFTDGRFVGPDHEGVVLPGGGDFTRIRHDGIGIVM